MELFSEINSAYYRTVEKVLRQAQEKPLSGVEIQKILSECTFSESALSIFPKLQSGAWPLLRKSDGRYVPALAGLPENPMTNLQKSWLRALLDDLRFRLFFSDAEIAKMRESLPDTEPLYRQNDFHVFDKALDGDDYESPDYQNRFRTLLSAIRGKYTLYIQYEGGKGSRVSGVFRPVKLEYSPKDDKFRAHCTRNIRGRIVPYTLNLGRITSATPVCDEPSHGAISHIGEMKSRTKQVVMEITRERNALERCMVHFAHFEKRTEYDEKTDKFTCTIHYNVADEAEVVIRVLSFGPTIRVISPEPFVTEIRERVMKQTELILSNTKRLECR